MMLESMDTPTHMLACDPKHSKGRHWPESESATRNAFQRDRDRIIHCGAFRRLKEKTQVFIAHEGDQHRTRLTHSLEVAQIARSIARTLNVDEDLAELVGLAHDLGHPSFGHAGERVLAEKMKDFGGFDHNAQALRVVTNLEVRYPDFVGLNLCWESLEGIVKHNGPLLRDANDRQNLPWAIIDYDDWENLDLGTHAGLEAQIAAVSDDIAYNNHDLDDGLRSGILQLEALYELPLLGDILLRTEARWPDITPTLLVHQTVRDLIGIMVRDVLAETGRRLSQDKPKCAGDVRAAARPMVAFSEDMTVKLSALRRHLFANMYRHPRVNQMMDEAHHVMRDLFDAYQNDPETLPRDVQTGMIGADSAQRARRVCDYIAGMTDRFAIREHHRLCKAGA